MFALFRRKAVPSVGRLAAKRTTLRYSTGGHGKAGDGVHHGTEHAHHHAGPVNESFGLSFYLILAAVPISIGVYKLSRPEKDGTPANPVSRIIDTYTDARDKWMSRAVLHTAMVEQAAFDRNLFQGTDRVKHVNLRFPEVFNSGSPWNIQAGQGADLTQLVQHYENINAEGEARKLKALEAKKSL